MTSKLIELTHNSHNSITNVFVYDLLHSVLIHRVTTININSHNFLPIFIHFTKIWHQINFISMKYTHLLFTVDTCDDGNGKSSSLMSSHCDPKISKFAACIIETQGDWKSIPPQRIGGFLTHNSIILCQEQFRIFIILQWKYLHAR